MNIKLTKDAERDYKKLIRNGQKNILKKLVQIFNELEVNPREGIGQPERLKYFRDKEVWSRKLDKKNRIVYLITLLSGEFGNGYNEGAQSLILCG